MDEFSGFLLGDFLTEVSQKYSQLPNHLKVSIVMCVRVCLLNSLRLSLDPSMIRAIGISLGLSGHGRATFPYLVHLANRAHIDDIPMTRLCRLGLTLWQNQLRWMSMSLTMD